MLSATVIAGASTLTYEKCRDRSWGSHNQCKGYPRDSRFTFEQCMDKRWGCPDQCVGYPNTTGFSFIECMDKRWGSLSMCRKYKSPQEINFQDCMEMNQENETLCLQYLTNIPEIPSLLFFSVIPTFDLSNGCWNAKEVDSLVPDFVIKSEILEVLSCPYADYLKIKVKGKYQDTIQQVWVNKKDAFIIDHQHLLRPPKRVSIIGLPKTWLVNNYCRNICSPFYTHQRHLNQRCIPGNLSIFVDIIYRVSKIVYEKTCNGEEYVLVRSWDSLYEEIHYHWILKQFTQPLEL